MVGDPTDLPENPTKAECTQVARSLPVICKMFGKKSCVAFNSKMSAKCGANAAFNMEDDNEDIGEDDDEEMAASDDEHAMADEDEDDSNDVGESAGLGRRGGGGLMTSGSFVMMSANRAGNDEEELGEEDDEEQVEEAFRIITGDTRVKALLVNIFGGIMKCDIIAQGIVNAARKLDLKVPLIVRLEGTNVEKGVKILQESGLPIITALNLDEAARKAVAAVPSV